jgi:hypothetical protein
MMKTRSVLKYFLPKKLRSTLKTYRAHHRLFEVVERGFIRNQEWKVGNGIRTSTAGSSPSRPEGDSINPLRSFFEAHTEGRILWKFEHYFDIYHRHLAKFIGQEVHLLEIGVYAGGSLEMWKHYFGPKCRIYGVDNSEACKTYEDDQVRIFTGDASDRNFWATFRKEVPILDIVIDDGGHQAIQQIVTLEETLPHLRRGGVYICEDVQSHPDYYNEFDLYMYGLINNLNKNHNPREISFKHRSGATAQGTFQDLVGGFASMPSAFQSAIHSVHMYPFVVAIESLETPVSEFVCAKHGTQGPPWSP